jgi:drug/metabolite transporter (DMT)-like permease
MAMQRQGPMSRGAWSMLVILSLLWGSSFFFFKILAAALPPFTIVLGRVGLAAIILNAYLLLRRSPLRADYPWRQFIVMGTLNNVIPFSLIAWGEGSIPSGLAAILNATTPVFSVLLAHGFIRSEGLPGRTWIGVLLGFCAVILLIGPGALPGWDARSLLGEAACLGAALSYACAGIYGRRFRALPPLHVATGQVTGATLVILPIAALTDRFWALPMPSATVWVALTGIAVICTVLAYILYFRILATAGATNLLLVTFLLPVTALLLGSLFLGEAITPRAVVAMAMIGASLAAIDGRPGAALSAAWKRLAKPPQLNARGKQR